MTQECPYCIKNNKFSSSRIIKFGNYYRRSDKRYISRYLCKSCGTHFSKATFDKCINQKRRDINLMVTKLLSSGVSQRRAAIILSVNRKTIVKKFLFLGIEAMDNLRKFNQFYPKSDIVEFDDLETFEHSKLKPLSVSLVVESKTRRILDFEVSQMPAKGLIAKLSVKKYGKRQDHRRAGRRRLFKRLKALVADSVKIKSDENPHYLKDIKKHFPDSIHEIFKGRRGCVVGQGELKKIGFDPLFSLNHTCAKLRADINRLFRKTWCTTKLPERLAFHIAIMAVEHNLSL